MPFRVCTGDRWRLWKVGLERTCCGAPPFISNTFLYILTFNFRRAALCFSVHDHLHWVVSFVLWCWVASFELDSLTSLTTITGCDTELKIKLYTIPRAFSCCRIGPIYFSSIISCYFNIYNPSALQLVVLHSATGNVKFSNHENPNHYYMCLIKLPFTNTKLRVSFQKAVWWCIGGSAVSRWTVNIASTTRDSSSNARIR